MIKISRWNMRNQCFNCKNILISGELTIGLMKVYLCKDCLKKEIQRERSSNKVIIAYINERK